MYSTAGAVAIDNEILVKNTEDFFSFAKFSSFSMKKVFFECDFSGTIVFVSKLDQTGVDI